MCREQRPEWPQAHEVLLYLENQVIGYVSKSQTQHIRDTSYSYLSVNRTMALVSVFQGQEDLSGVSVYIIFLCNSYKEETWLFKELILRNALIQQIDSNTHFANLYAINVTLKICAEKKWRNKL